MTVRTTKLGGTNWSDGEVLYAADLNNSWFGYLNNSTGGGSNAEAETSIAKITIPANTVKYGILIFADIVCGVTAGTGTAAGTFRIRCGTDATIPTNNVQLITAEKFYASTDKFQVCGGGLHYFYIGANWTVTNYLDITFLFSKNVDIVLYGRTDNVTIMYF